MANCLIKQKTFVFPIYNNKWRHLRDKCVVRHTYLNAFKTTAKRQKQIGDDIIYRTASHNVNATRCLPFSCTWHTDVLWSRRAAQRGHIKMTCLVQLHPLRINAYEFFWSSVYTVLCWQFLNIWNSKTV